MLKYKYVIKILFILFSSISSKTVFAENEFHILNSHYKTSQTMFNLSDGSNYNTWNMKGYWTDNFSNFGSVNCVGQAQSSKQKDLSIHGVCEIKDEKKLKKWWTIERNIGVTELGVGKSVQLAAEVTGEF